MTPTLRQCEEWERKRNLALQKLQEEIDELEYKLGFLHDEFNRIELMTIDDSYFEFLAGRGSEK